MTMEDNKKSKKHTFIEAVKVLKERAVGKLLAVYDRFFLIRANLRTKS